MNNFLEKLFTDKPYQRRAHEAAQFLKQYAESCEGEKAFEDWCVVDIDTMMHQIRIAMDDIEGEWNEYIKDPDRTAPTAHDEACQHRTYLIYWFILQNLCELRKEHGAFKHCADMVTLPD